MPCVLTAIPSSLNSGAMDKVCGVDWSVMSIVAASPRIQRRRLEHVQAIPNPSTILIVVRGCPSVKLSDFATHSNGQELLLTGPSNVSKDS